MPQFKFYLKIKLLLKFLKEVFQILVKIPHLEVGGKKFRINLLQ